MSREIDIVSLLRKNIRSLKPYSSARSEYQGREAVLLDANESPFNEPFNRYPDPSQTELKERIGEMKGVAPGNIFLGNGSDEAIDLLIRAFASPREDNIVTISPTYGMYKVAADINDVEVRGAPLGSDFSLVPDRVLDRVTPNTKLLFLCSPNNPTGNILEWRDIKTILSLYDGIVVVDEAYIDFCPGRSLIPHMTYFNNLVILQTFSKAWGMAGMRLGMAFGDTVLIDALTHIKYPYNLNMATQLKALEIIEQEDRKSDWVKAIIDERERMAFRLKELPFVSHVYDSDSNFLLVKTDSPKKIYEHLVGKNIIVRDRSEVILCEGCIRITIGSEKENFALLSALEQLV